MLADDEVYLLEAMKNLIAWDKMECQLLYCAKNGKELLDHIHEYEPDIVITDINMPLVNGIEVAKYIYENMNRTKVIILTACASFEYAQEAIRYDVCDYIIKTATLEKLPKAIERAIDKLKSDEKEENLKENVPEDIMDKIQSYLRKNYMRKISLEDIARSIHASRSYTSRIYKEKTGVNLFDAINKMKVDKAKEYINRGMKVCDVAERVGFEDVTYFSKVFKKFEGCSPKDFKRKNKSDYIE